MRESVWGYAVIALGIIAVGVIWFFANVTRTDQNNYNLLKETVESAMYDAIDFTEYRSSKTLSIDGQKFVENFIRRFSENADLSNGYVVEIYDVNETPPKVSLRVRSSKDTNVTNELMTFDISNSIDAIFESEYVVSGSNDSGIEGYHELYTCTEKNPCYYVKEYISVSKELYNCEYMNTNFINPKKHFTWEIFLGSLVIDNDITKYIDDSKLYTIDEPPNGLKIFIDDVQYLGSSISDREYDEEYKGNKWYAKYKTSDGVEHDYVSPSEDDVKAIKDRTAHFIVDEENTSFTLDGSNKIKAKVMLNFCPPVQDNVRYITSKYLMLFKYYYTK